MVYWAASFSKADKGGQKVAKHYPILANKNDIMYRKALTCTTSSFTGLNPNWHETGRINLLVMFGLDIVS